MTLIQTSKEYIGGKWQLVGFYQTKSGKTVIKPIKDYEQEND